MASFPLAYANIRRVKKWADPATSKEVTQSGKKLVPRVSGAAVKVFEGTIQI